MLPEKFLPSLKHAGFEVNGEPALVERLHEAGDWQTALLTLLRNGRRIGITFTRKHLNNASVHKLAEQFRLNPAVERELESV